VLSCKLARFKFLFYLGLSRFQKPKLDKMKFRLFSIWAVACFALSACTKLSLEEEGNLVPRTVLEDVTVPSIQVNGVRLHSETFGKPSDPMLVVLHGDPGGRLSRNVELQKACL
jgi:proline iminopeptidase